MSGSFTNEQIEAYRKNFLEHGDTPRGVFWNNQDTQYLRFERLLKNLDITTPFSIHDIGCATCSLHEYLLNKKIKHDYHGTEIVPEMVTMAKKKYPEITVKERDILKDTVIETCDYGIVSGTFNLKGDSNEKEWENYVFALMKKLFTVSSKAVAFNFLTTYKTFTDPTLAYFNPQEVFDFCMKNFSRFVIIDHAYPLYEFTITVYKQDYMEQMYNNPLYGKYFGK